MKISIVMPAFNEDLYISKTIEKLENKADFIIIVDDGSQDSTFEKIKLKAKNNNKIIPLKHQINLGKGATLKTGCEAALKLGADVIICMDSDDQHDPSEIPHFITEIKKGNDIVYGYRIFNQKMPLVMSLGNRILSGLIHRFFKILIKDTQSGYRAFTKEAYKKIKWQSRDYAVETEMIINAAKHNLRYSEISIKTIYHDNYKGTTPITGLQIFFKILKWKFL